MLNVLGWNGTGFKFPSGNCNPLIVQARKATLRYLKDLSQESNFSASLFLEFAEIIAEYKSDNVINKSETQINKRESQTTDNRKDIKLRPQKVNVEKMATLGDIAKNTGDTEGTYVALSGKNGDFVKAFLRKKPREEGGLQKGQGKRLKTRLEKGLETNSIDDEKTTS